MSGWLMAGRSGGGWNNPAKNSALLADDALSSNRGIGGFEIRHGLPQTVFQGNFRLPTKHSFRLADIRAALAGIVFRQRLENNLEIGSHQPANAFRKLQNRQLVDRKSKRLNSSHVSESGRPF